MADGAAVFAFDRDGALRCVAAEYVDASRRELWLEGMRAEIAAHSHASVAATRDRFGGASWLSEHEVDDFMTWPLELRKLTLEPPSRELAGYVAIVTGSASGIGSCSGSGTAAGEPLVAAARGGSGFGAGGAGGAGALPPSACSSRSIRAISACTDASALGCADLSRAISSWTS